MYMFLIYIYETTEHSPSTSFFTVYLLLFRNQGRDRTGLAFDILAFNVPYEKESRSNELEEDRIDFIVFSHDM